MFPAVMDEVFTLDQRKNVFRNMFNKACRSESDIEHQANRLQNLIGSYGILEQVGLIQDELKELRKELRDMRRADAAGRHAS